MRKLTFCLALLAALFVPTTTHASSRPITWERQTLHMDWATASHSVRTVTHHYRIRHATSQPTGYWTATVRRSPHVLIRTRFPVFAKPKPIVQTPSGRTISAWITGYAYGCGAYGNPGASGIMPFVGMVSSDVYPQGTHIYVPSLGYRGTVLDTGVGTGGFDLFEPNCAASFAITGERQVTIY